jgi:dihydrofolate reductase
MRKLIYAINLTLDGCCDHTKVIPYDDMVDYHTSLLGEVGVLLYGRKTYELMIPFWPDIARSQSGSTKSMNDFARAFDAVDKIVVVSRTLKKPEGNKTKVVRDNLQEEMLKLKQEEGKDIVVGGVELPEQLMKLGLIDEYRFIVEPVITGEGRRLWDGARLAEKLQLKFVDSKMLTSGSIALRYSRN